MQKLEYDHLVVKWVNGVHFFEESTTRPDQKILSNSSLASDYEAQVSAKIGYSLRWPECKQFCISHDVWSALAIVNHSKPIASFQNSINLSQAIAGPKISFSRVDMATVQLSCSIWISGNQWLHTLHDGEKSFLYTLCMTGGHKCSNLDIDTLQCAFVYFALVHLKKTEFSRTPFVVRFYEWPLNEMKMLQAMPNTPAAATCNQHASYCLHGAS
jgi:hypothetical protein